MDYETLRHFADTWGLVFLVTIFLSVIAWVFRPGAGRVYEESARIPLKED
ncbi:MAG TPA: cbb3-type cytochrome c oxidase subunit 3 [Hyphomicrobiales bacterium]|nr:cbb3-type cytochrome c oxidase subunit 3 [Rhodobiaceae bacterium]HXK53728.1 cbb3-type cytochrome c oxidase subunit 3 [Hyphomicrobiales bacterium]